MTPDPREIRHHVPVTRMTLTTWDAELFKRAYRAKGLTLQQVAIKSGIPYSAIRSYSAGRASPTPERLLKLASTLQLRTTELAPLREPATLHELRWHTGLTVGELAARAGYSLSHTRLVLSGVSPIIEAARWSAALETDEEQVFRAWNAARAEHAEPADGAE